MDTATKLRIIRPIQHDTINFRNSFRDSMKIDAFRQKARIQLRKIYSESSDYIRQFDIIFGSGQIEVTGSIVGT